jgi:hypothetical protein
MSYYIIKNETMKHFDNNKIIFGEKITNGENKKYYIYYEDNDAKEIYIKMPKIRMIFNNFINQKYNIINIPIYPLWNVTQEFINFINHLELIIQDTISTKNSFCSLLSKKNGITNLRLSIDKPKIIGNIPFNDFKINSEIELMIKISSVWINKKTKLYGLSCNLYQIKYHAPPEQNIIDFIDEPIKPIIPKPPILEEPKHSINKLILNPHELITMKNKLKKMTSLL